MAKSKPVKKKSPAPKPAAKPAPKPVAKKAAPAKPAPAKAVKAAPPPKPAKAVKAVKPQKPAAAPAKPAGPKLNNNALISKDAPNSLPGKPVVIAPGVVSTDGTVRPKMGSGMGQRPMRRPKIKKPVVMPSLGAPLLGPGSKRPTPIIASGPKAPAVSHGSNHAAPVVVRKTHFNKKELDYYRQILLRKRAELAGDITKMEGEALQGSSGSLSHLPQHMADQGSDAYDQSLSLEIAQVDRKLIKEIDDALTRIAALTYGVCEATGKPISKDRLEELPWTRFSIEAARAKEHRA
ncbi:MAG: TraR/DksA family transcriptional regulator, partial [Phycisphaerales bacterium]